LALGEGECLASRSGTFTLGILSGGSCVERRAFWMS